ncbi:MAG TPA: hypothetical protein VGQ41_19935 [Pyrinomonadaceae bacterium]|jgi:hypothetical protein|nr:hypothetical protein [Pyrinomonadaceae bacterium]
MVTSTESQLFTRATELRAQVQLVVNSTSVMDVHTHLFPAEFNGMCLYGIDELLTYHYLTAETLRSARISHDRFWQLSKTDQADLVWQTLFVENSPASEAARGIISVLDAFSLDTRAENLSEARAFFNSRRLSEHIDRVFDIARVSGVVMTNDPLDDVEVEFWNSDIDADPRFKSSMRLDRLLNDWERAVVTLARRGVSVNADLDAASINELRSFLDKWIERMAPVYMGVSLPSDFKFPADDHRDQLLREVVLPTAEEHGLALTLMIGVRRRVNPKLREAGDGVGKADVTTIERLCAISPDVKFLATFLSRENQHELCVAARKFNNLMPFGCWWFLNNPSIVSEITRERLELLGTSFIPQHSDARVLEQLIYKWKHARKEIADALCDSYQQLLSSGRAVTAEEISRDVVRMFSGNFKDWVGF